MTKDKLPIVELKGITKTFPGVVANDQISIKFYPGEVHALLGENGAGKRTERACPFPPYGGGIISNEVSHPQEEL